jgi:hypothetical protein
VNGLPSATLVDDVVGGEALGLVQLGRLEHAQANVGDHIGRALDNDGDQSQPILCGDRRRGHSATAHVLRAVAADQVWSDPQRVIVVLWRRYRALAATTG